MVMSEKNYILQCKNYFALFSCKFHHKSLICLPTKKLKSKHGNTRKSMGIRNLMKYLWPVGAQSDLLIVRFSATPLRIRRELC